MIVKVWLFLDSGSRLGNNCIMINYLSLNNSDWSWLMIKIWLMMLVFPNGWYVHVAGSVCSTG